MDNNLLLFFTSVDSKYKRFILPYVFFAHAFNLFAKFEIAFVGSDDELRDLQSKSQVLGKQIGCEILIRKPLKPNSDIHKIRFYEEPITKCKYTYCGDVDIMILEPIIAFHTAQMDLYGMIFDNTIRYQNHQKLSGLHFVVSEPYYKATATARSADIGKYDEMDLMEICKRSGLKFKPETINVTDFNISRPDHGFHISLNRKPFCSSSPMTIDLSLYHYKILSTIINSVQYQKLSLELFDKEFNAILAVAFNYIKSQKFCGQNVSVLSVPNQDNKKYVVYTCQTGNYDAPIIDSFYDVKNFDYFYFTDNPQIFVNPIWKIVDISKMNWIFPQKIKDDNAKKARFIKTHPHLFFDKYEKSIWIDANMKFISSPMDFLNEVNDNYPFLATRHFNRTCIYQEAHEVKIVRKDDPNVVDAEIECLKHNLYPSNNGLIESGFLIRKHNNQLCAFTMEQWWAMIEGYSKRDQLSFNYIQWRNQLPYKMISQQQRENIIKIVDHK